MDAVKFIEERDRMCKAYYDAEKGYCADECPAHDIQCTDLDDLTAEAEELVKATEEWSAAHPRKTRQDVFLEQWPKAYVKYGMPTIRPCDLYAKYRKANGDCARHGINCAQCCTEFWRQEVE